MLRTDDLGGGYRLTQNTAHFCMGADSLLLSKFAHILPGDHVVDLCAGNGAVGVLLCIAHPDIRVTGVELQPTACALAEENIAQNGLSPRMKMLCGDVKAISALLPPEGADAVVCNPPYFPANTGRYQPDKPKSIARFELHMTLTHALFAAAYLIKPGGWLYLSYLPERQAECIAGMAAQGLAPLTLQPVHHAPGKKPAFVLLAAQKGGKGSLTELPPIYLQEERL